MSLDDRTAQEKLTPDERRAMLRAFADRMLLKVSAMDDPEDMPGVEKAVRVAAVIERIYYRCDRAERHTPDPRKVEAERAAHQSAAIKARVALATDLEWGEMRQKQLGKWWDATQTTAPAPVIAPALVPEPLQPAPQKPAQSLNVQGAALKQRLNAMSEKTLGRIETTTPQTAADIIASANYILKAHASLQRADITAEELSDLGEDLDDWLQGRPHPP